MIHAGSGGVGTFAIQLAKLMGATVAMILVKQVKDLVKSLGADEIINYKTENFENILKNYDAVFDTLGGTRHSKNHSDVIKNEGRTLFPFQDCRMLVLVKNMV